MNPAKLIGMGYRLGADPERHGAVDCLSLAQTVLASYGIPTPRAERTWYRRLKHRDYSIFKEELERWGHQISTPRIGAVALCEGENGGYGMAVYWEYGWLNISEGRAVRWSPTEALPLVAIYCP